MSGPVTRGRGAPTDAGRAARLHVEGLTVRYPGADEAVVRDVGFTVEAGEIVALVGESGSGKSTALRAIARLLGAGDDAEVRAGVLAVDGRSIATLRAGDVARLDGGGIASVFQDPRRALDPVRTVGAQVAEAIRLHRRVGRREAKREAERTLERAGMPQAAGVLGRYPHQLSGGQCQRVVIALALACGPRVLLADEPTTALDVTTERRLLALFRELAAEGLAIVFVTHDLRVVSDIADRVIVLDAGRVVEAGITADVFASPAHETTARLLRARPRLGATKGRFGLDDASVTPDPDPSPAPRDEVPR